MNEREQKTIASFEIDHTRLFPGLYISRIDRFNGVPITSFDLRFVKPNSVLTPALPPASLHTIEHLGAVYLRNYSGWEDKIVYFGPMGCRTGCYAVIAGEYQPHDQSIKELFINMARFITEWNGDVPGATEKECGNYLDQNLLSAKKVMEDWSQVLSSNHLDYDQFVYPE